MATITVVKPISEYNEYGEYTGCNQYIVTHYCKCVEHYPNTSKNDIVQINGQFEGTKEYEIAWLDSCKCTIGCDTDIQEGYFAYLMNKYWKIVGIRLYGDCGCYTIKLTLERLEPRESHKELIECVNCFQEDNHVHC